jgi:hypothetical protein
MDQSFLLALGLALLVALGSGARIRNRMLADRAGEATLESPFAVSTEGHKICLNCGMGNLWTDRTCISCRGPLKG